MANGKIIDNKFYLNRNTGQRASVYGAVPWRSTAEAEGWTMATAGYTIAWDDGTIGTGKPAFATYEDAETYLAKMDELGLKGGWRDMTY